MSLLEILREASIWLKVGAVIVGLGAAFLWFRSATTSGPAAAQWNKRAAIATGVSVALQAISVAIDSWVVAPTASWAR
jgi:hypothetical protein